MFVTNVTYLVCFLLLIMSMGTSIEADLGRFSEAIYKKILSDAKKQRFQGFRPGTIPPHLEPTYRTFTMDECARETVLEAMEQNSIRPFSTARSDLVIEQVRIPKPKMTTKKKKGGKKESDQDPIEATNEENAESKWLLFDNMKGAIDAGWKVRIVHVYIGEYMAHTCCAVYVTNIRNVSSLAKVLALSRRT